MVKNVMFMKNTKRIKSLVTKQKNFTHHPTQMN